MRSIRPSAPLGIAAVIAILVGIVALGGSRADLGAGATELLLFLVTFAVIIPAHELGHAFVGTVVGYRIRSVVVGVGPPLWQLQVAGVMVRINLLPFGGITSGLAHRSTWPRLRMWVFAAGGPAANLLLCWLLKRHTGHGAMLAPGEHSVAAVAAAASWAVLFLNLVPFRTGEGQASDGYSLLTVPFWSRERVLRASVLAGGAPILMALQQGDFITAERTLAELRARYGDHPVVQGYTGMLLHRLGRHEEARSAWRASLAGDTDPFARLLMKNNIAWADFLLDDRASAAEADAYSEEALAARPDVAAFAGTRGAVLDWLGRSPEALPLLQRALAGQADPRGQASNHACLAMVLAHLGRLDEAAAHRASARQLDPTCALLPRAEAVDAASDLGALGMLQVARAASAWDRWGGLLRWRQVARGLATITLLIPDRPFDLALLACLMVVLVDPQPAGLAALAAMQLWLGLLWAFDRTSGINVSIGVATIAWVIASGMAIIGLALVRDRLGPRAPSRTTKVLGWVLGVPCAARVLLSLLPTVRHLSGPMSVHDWLAPFRVSPGPAALYVGFAAVLLASGRRSARACSRWSPWRWRSCRSRALCRPFASTRGWRRSPTMGQLSFGPIHGPRR